MLIEIRPFNVVDWVDKKWTGNDLEGSRRFHKFTRVSGENHGNINQVRPMYRMNFEASTSWIRVYSVAARTSRSLFRVYILRFFDLSLKCISVFLEFYVLRLLMPTNWNAGTLERIQHMFPAPSSQTFLSSNNLQLCFCVEQIKLHILRKSRYHLDSLHLFKFSLIFWLSRFWKMYQRFFSKQKLSPC
jgi:hypothetical protein